MHLTEVIVEYGAHRDTQSSETEGIQREDRESAQQTEKQGPQEEKLASTRGFVSNDIRRGRLGKKETTSESLRMKVCV